MSAILTIAGREVRATLSSPLAYVFVGLFSAGAWGVFFFAETFFANDQATLRGFFSWVPALMAFICPALTMRLWADEMRLGTYELLATLPTRPHQLVLGKFLGAFALLILALLFTLGLPIVADSYGDLDWGPVFGGYVGALLIGASFLAVGLVTSFLFQDQFLALLVAWLACFLAFLPELIPNFPESLARWGFSARFADIERGVLTLSTVVFYGSVAAFWLFVNTQLLRFRRFSS